MIFLLTAALFALGCAYIEVQLVKHAKPLQHIYSHGLGPIPATWCVLTCSLALSFLLGEIFAAEGVTVFMAGIISTVYTSIWFAGEKALHSAGWSADRAKRDVSGLLNRATELREPAKRAWEVVLVFIKIIGFPVTIGIWLAHAWNKLKGIRVKYAK